MSKPLQNEPAESVIVDTPKSSKRACDCCRKRKVRCDGENPCGPCRKATIRCAYLQPPKKKGPKGLRSARVLHALRKIDESASLSPEGPLSPTVLLDGVSQQSCSSNSSPSAMPHHGYDDTHMPTSMPNPSSDYGHIVPEQQGYGILPSVEFMTLSTNPGMNLTWSALPSQPQYYAPLTSLHPALPQIPNQRFLPYVQLFFKHLFSIMPIIDRNVYLDPGLYSSSYSLPRETYAFLCALCAATIVQLDAATQVPTLEPLAGRPVSDSEMFIEECQKARKEFDYIGNPTPLTVMTSFFIFAYYGNIERRDMAWHYLQESISFAETLDMDDEDEILKLDPIQGQWRRRIYWLLFITERAYSIQRRKNCRLHPTIQLPIAFEFEDARLLHGFVNVAHLFSAVDDNFINIWKGARSLCSGPWLAETHRSLDQAALAMEDITETQQLDISVSRQWLHVLAWQMGVSNGLVWSKGHGGARLDYPIELARRTVQITEGANPLALDSHGIGMEQKLSDIAGCLADVLRVSSGDMSDTFIQGRQYLHLMLNKLSRIRGKESRYLRPLMLKTDEILNTHVPKSIVPPVYSDEGDDVDDVDEGNEVDDKERKKYATQQWIQQ